MWLELLALLSLLEYLLEYWDEKMKAVFIEKRMEGIMAEIEKGDMLWHETNALHGLNVGGEKAYITISMLQHSCKNEDI